MYYFVILVPFFFSRTKLHEYISRGSQVSSNEKGHARSVHHNALDAWDDNLRWGRAIETGIITSCGSGLWFCKLSQTRSHGQSQ